MSSEKDHPYHRLLKAWRMEQATDDLAKLDTHYFEEARTYIRSLKNRIEQDDELLRQLFEKRLQRAKYLRDDLIKQRIEKHIRQTLEILEKNYVTSPNSKSNMPQEEKRFRSKLEKLFEEFMSEAIEGSETFEVEEDTFVLVEVTEDLSKPFIGVDLLHYGPFKETDLVYLPSENAQNLVINRQGKKVLLD